MFHALKVLGEKEYQLVRIDKQITDGNNITPSAGILNVAVDTGLLDE